MIVIKCKNNSDLNRVYHLTKAFFPGKEIQQQINIEQEPQLEFVLDDGSCFTVLSDKASTDEKDEESIDESKETLIKKVYDYLSEYTNKTLPWGILTGVRPTKLVMKMVMEGTEKVNERDKEESETILREKYYLSKEKAKLAVEVATKEKETLEPLDLEDGFSLYVSIPFCPSICSYCSFGSGELGKWHKQVDEYVETLCDEIVSVGTRAHPLRKLNTIYIGGGTPTTLNTEQFGRLFDAIKEAFSLEHLIEYTVEAGRPETITKEKLRLFKKEGVTRISINPQSMNQQTLDRVGRQHKVMDIVEAFWLAREEGFDNINMDLIIGLPGEGVVEIHSTLAQIKELGPDSLTIHTLAMKRGSEASNEHKEKIEAEKRDHRKNHREEVVNKENTNQMEDNGNQLKANQTEDNYAEEIKKEDNINEMLNLCYDAAKEMGLSPYYLYRQKNIAGNFENVGFAKVDKAGIYNILMIEELQTIIGVGVGATTKILTREKKAKKNENEAGRGEEFSLTIWRRANTKEIRKYIAEGGREFTL